MIWKRIFPLFSLGWLCVLLLVFVWSYSRARKEHELLLRQTARSYFDLIVLARHWNAMHGKVYVPVDARTAPNPYLDVPNRDIRIDSRLTLTIINPAYMTRQLSELLNRKRGVYFHITSLRPVNPKNKPSPLERKALESFERGKPFAASFIQTAQGERYFYMAPLLTDPVCLQCHAKDGYKVGDVRGGISIFLPFEPTSLLGGGLWGHVWIGLVGLFVIFVLSLWLGRAYRKLLQQVRTDGLTGLLNRRAFYELLARDFAIFRRTGADYSLIMLDVDWFKAYNDHFGHLAGDMCLQKVAAAVQSALNRPGDFCGRYGGEEFVVALPHTDLSGALCVAEKIRLAVLELHLEHAPEVRSRSGGEQGLVSVSLGVASLHTSEASTPEGLLDESDRAMYRAKQQGRDQVAH